MPHPHDLNDNQKRETQYLILESQKNNAKYFHVITLSEKNKIAKLGRGSEADAKVVHTTISRIHAVFTFENNQIKLSD